MLGVVLSGTSFPTVCVFVKGVYNILCVSMCALTCVCVSVSVVCACIHMHQEHVHVRVCSTLDFKSVVLFKLRCPI